MVENPYLHLLAIALLMLAYFFIQKGMIQPTYSLLRLRHISYPQLLKWHHYLLFIFVLIFNSPLTLCRHLSQLLERGNKRILSLQKALYANYLLYLTPLYCFFPKVSYNLYLSYLTIIGFLFFLRQTEKKPLFQLFLGIFSTLSVIIFFNIFHHTSPLPLISASLSVIFFVIAILLSVLFQCSYIGFFISLLLLRYQIISFDTAYVCVLGISFGTTLNCLRQLSLRSLIFQNKTLISLMILLLCLYGWGRPLLSSFSLPFHIVLFLSFTIPVILMTSPSNTITTFLKYRIVQLHILSFVLLLYPYLFLTFHETTSHLLIVITVAHAIPALILYFLPRVGQAQHPIENITRTTLLKAIQTEQFYFLEQLNRYFLSEKSCPDFSYRTCEKFENNLQKHEMYLTYLMSFDNIKGSLRKEILNRHCLGKEILQLFYNLSSFILWLKQHKEELPATFLINLWESSEILIDTITQAFVSLHEDEIAMCLAMTSQQKQLLTPLKKKYLTDSSKQEAFSAIFLEAFDRFERMCWSLHSLAHLMREQMAFIIKKQKKTS